MEEAALAEGADRETKLRSEMVETRLRNLNICNPYCSCGWNCQLFFQGEIGETLLRASELQLAPGRGWNYSIPFLSRYSTLPPESGCECSQLIRVLNSKLRDCCAVDWALCLDLDHRVVEFWPFILSSFVRLALHTVKLAIGALVRAMFSADLNR